MNTAWILVAVGLLVALMTFLAAIGVLKPNGLIGIRTPSTKLSPEAWRRGHAAAARVTVPLGLVVSAFGLCLALGWPEFLVGLGQPAALAGIVVIAVGTLISGRIAETAAKKVNTVR